MKKTLSFWERVYRDLCWAGSGLKAFWRIGPKFYFSPTERNLLVSFWYDYHHFRRVQPEMSIDDYLDWRVRDIKRIVVDLRRSVKTRQLNGDLLQALGDEQIRSMFVGYLRADSPSDHRPMVAAIRGAWREKGGQDANKGRVTVVSEGQAGEVDERGAGEVDEGQAGEENEPVVDEPVGSEGPALQAKAYVIATQLDHELREKESDFEILSRDLPGFVKFVKQHFGVRKLPGTFEKFKGYSYKLILNDRSAPKKGQLRKPFRQIRDHPEIFGEAVAARAAEILRRHFK